MKLENRRTNTIEIVVEMEDKVNIMQEKLAKHIVGENGISYTLGEHDLYYPDLEIPEGTHYEIGKYGRMREKFLKEHRHSHYMDLLLRGKLNEYLYEIDKECNERTDIFMEQMKVKWDITEELKRKDQMLWVGKMNNLHSVAEEVVIAEIITI